jgi:hypothetical protein
MHYPQDALNFMNRDHIEFRRAEAYLEDKLAPTG